MQTTEIHTLSEALRVHRQRNRLDQASIATALHVAQQSVSKWEAGVIPRPELVPAIAALLGLDEEQVVVMAYRAWKLRQ